MTEDMDRAQDARQKVTPEALTRAAYRYLARFASTEAQLVKVLKARVERALKPCGDKQAMAQARGAVLEVARHCAGLGLVNDRLYGEAKARRLLAQGKPSGMIRAALTQKGVGRADIDFALSQLAVEMQGRDLDHEAAIAYARRRRLGPFARPGHLSLDGAAQSDRRRKEYAAMARAGFGYELSRRVLGAASVDEVEC
jgi:regulatory protein